MDNHFHIVVETLDGNLSAGMRQLNGVYTQWHNRTHGHVGHVFQGRFKAIIVQREAYLLALARYVVLNPVRAGVCAIASNGTGAAIWQQQGRHTGLTGCTPNGYCRNSVTSTPRRLPHTSTMSWPA